MTERYIKYTPRSGTEMLKAAPPNTGLYMYSKLASDPRPALEIFKSMKRNSIILLQDPDDMHTGHWISLSFHPEKHEAYFFSSYGGVPDKEKIKWIPKSDRMKSGQMRNFISDGLKQLYKCGWKIYYNDKPYQIPSDKTATCGIWTVAFLNDGRNPDEFAKHSKSVEAYYRKYFS